MVSEYRSNNGQGPFRARVLASEGDRVTLERWDERSAGRGKRPDRVIFTLSRAFFDSPACGWRRVPAPKASAPQAT